MGKEAYGELGVYFRQGISCYAARNVEFIVCLDGEDCCAGAGCAFGDWGGESGGTEGEEDGEGGGDMHDVCLFYYVG